MRPFIALMMLACGCGGGGGASGSSRWSSRGLAPDDPKLAAAVTAVIEATGPRKKSLPRSIDVYHYVQRSKLGLPRTGTLDFTLPMIADHVRNWGAYFLDPAQANGGFDARGLYTATDPITTLAYGRSEFLLFRVRLAEATSYLDITDREEDVPASVATAVIAAGCQPDIMTWRRVLMNGEVDACRAIALDVLARLSVEALAYHYQAVDFDGCTGRGPSAFVLFGKQTLTKAPVQVFAADIPTPDPARDERLAIEGMFYLSPLAKQVPELDPWPILAPTPGLRDAAAAWLKRRVLYCNGIRN
jgi:hypothetical protein